MPFILLANNAFFFSLSLYGGHESACLYLQVKHSNARMAHDLLLAIDGLKAIETKDDESKHLIQPRHLEMTQTLRFEHMSDIVLILQWASTHGYINRGQQQTLIQELRSFKHAEVDQFIETWEKAEMFSDDFQIESPLSGLSLNTEKSITHELSQMYDDEDTIAVDLTATTSTPTLKDFTQIALHHHIEQAFEAVKQGNKKLLSVLLGNGVTEQDLEEYDTKRENLDSHVVSQFSKQLLTLISTYQQTIVADFLTLSKPTEADFKYFAQTFANSLWDAKAAIIADSVKENVRPYLPGSGIDFEQPENFADWLDTILKSQISMIIMPPNLQSLSHDKLKVLQKDLTKTLLSESNSLNDLNNLRSQHSVKFDEINERIKNKSCLHAENIRSLLDVPLELPEIYRYQSPLEKQALIKLLEDIKVPINAKDSAGNTLLHYAMGANNLELIILLFQHDIDETIQNNVNQAAHVYAHKSHTFLLEIKKLANNEAVKKESSFLTLYKQHSDHYELSLRTDEAWLKSLILRILGKLRGLNEDITLAKREIKNQLDALYALSVAKGDPILLLEGIEKLCVKENTKRGLRNKSFFYDKLLKLARKTRANMEGMLGALGAVGVTSALSLEQELVSTKALLTQRDEELQCAITERDQAKQEVQAVSLQNSELTLQNRELMKTLAVHAQKIEAFETSRAEMETLMQQQAADYQQKLQKQQEVSRKEMENFMEKMKEDMNRQMLTLIVPLAQQLQIQEDKISYSLPSSPRSSPRAPLFTSASAKDTTTASHRSPTPSRQNISIKNARTMESSVSEGDICHSPSSPRDVFFTTPSTEAVATSSMPRATTPIPIMPLKGLKNINNAEFSSLVSEEDMLPLSGRMSPGN